MSCACPGLAALTGASALVQQLTALSIAFCLAGPLHAPHDSCTTQVQPMHTTAPSTAALPSATQGRNRRCMTVDLHKPEGREVVRQLAARCDVLVENFRPGVMEKWGLGPQDLPDTLVYARISGYGQVGGGQLWRGGGCNGT